MTQAVVAPDGTAWTVRRVRAPWRLRHRVEFAPDIVGILLWVLGFAVLLVEAVLWLGALAIQRLRHARGLPWVIEAHTAGPPDRVLRWSAVGSATSAARATEIAAALAQGQDVASTASKRLVGGTPPR
ncbi:MAG: hypothetical protein WC558_09250 [Patulibacter sp.]